MTLAGFDSSHRGLHTPAMTTPSFDLTRRQILAGLGATTALTLGGCAATGGVRPGKLAELNQRSAAFMLDQVGYSLLEHEPERATGLGVDTGKYAPLRARLEDQSAGRPAGLCRPAAQGSRAGPGLATR